MNRMVLLSLPILASLAPIGTSPAPAAEWCAKKPILGLATAQRVVKAAAALARANGGTGAIAVVDDGGHLLLLERLDGTFAAAARIATGKAHTAAMFRKPTRVFEKLVLDGRTTMVALEDFTPLRGGVPLAVDGYVVGAIGVSGAASADWDDTIAEAGRAAMEVAGGGTTTYFPSTTVDAAFTRGEPLLENGEFKIHASRRDGPGQAEVHEHETDIVYVREGTATFVTGGTVTGGRKTAPGQIRGDAIEGGNARRLMKGDIVVVPAGVPHWFSEVDGAFTYYVVKVLR